MVVAACIVLAYVDDANKNSDFVGPSAVPKVSYHSNDSMSKTAHRALVRQLQRTGSCQGLMVLRPTVTLARENVSGMPGTSSRLYASAAVAVPEQDVSRTTNVAPVPTTPLGQALQETYELLESEIGGDGVWSARVQFAQDDLLKQRRPRLGGLFNQQPYAGRLLIRSLR